MQINNEPCWQPSAPLEAIKARGVLLAAIRDYFREAGVLEVETPACSAFAVTDPALCSLTTCYTGPGAASGRELYLHTSPEFPMKRLLAAGSGPIYQICKVFRDGEAGRIHNPEFTLLEWYRPGFNQHQLMDEVARLIQAVLPSSGPVHRVSYAELFQSHLGIDPHNSSAGQLRLCAIEQQIPGADSLALTTADAWLDLLLTHCIEPRLERGLCFVYDYPATQASLAKIRPGDPAVAERFELYLDGLEIANGFHELADAVEQRSRFEQELLRRRDEGCPQVPMDEYLLQALDAGLPDCSGVALGIDRLLMQVMGVGNIDQVIAFPFARA